MTQYGVISLGRNSLVEFPAQPGSETAAAPTTNAPTGRTLSIAGQESNPSAPTVNTSLVQLAATRSDLEGLAGSFIPVTFTDKTGLNGYYVVQDVSTDLIDWEKETQTLAWKADLLRIGSDYEVDIESRLTGGVRNNSFSASGVRWHAPSINHFSYFTASGNVPSVLVRTGADGPMNVYLGLPLTGSVIPRWGCFVGDYLRGRVRFLDDNGLERAGTQFANGTPSGWTLSNALVQITPLSSAGGVLNVAPYSSAGGGTYPPKNWDIRFNGTSLGTPLTISLLRNEPEIVVARLLWSVTSIPARVTADLTLRRGSRFLELYVQAQSSGTIKVVRSVAEAGTNGGAGEYVSATANDGSGNRYIVGSALTNIQDLVNGGVSASASVSMDVFIGNVQGGSGAVSGDTAADLYAQYVAAPAELVQGIRR